MENVYIFGAHSRARTLKEYLSKVRPDQNVIAYLVDNEEENPKEADGLPTYFLPRDGDLIHVENTVYLGIKGVNQKEVTKRLIALGFQNIIPLTVAMDTQLRNEYLTKIFAKRGETFLKLDKIVDEHNAIITQKMRQGNEQSKIGGFNEDLKLGIYVASSAFDSALQEKHDYLENEKVIQVGCALTDKRIPGVIFDDEGESISERNAQFCELTALYWIWKNAKDDYVGLEHYRRFFVLPADYKNIVSANAIDVILPVPLYVAPNLQENYKFRHEEKIWDDMLQFLENRSQEEYQKAIEYFNQGLYSPCNMLIARKEIFDALCEWMFPILFYVAEKNGILPDRYQNRYPGFLSERLMSFYFNLHKEQWKIVYADKVFLQ